MAYTSQIPAKRLNAQFSTVPKTPETKSISAANSRGPIARFLLGSEDTEEYRTFVDDITGSYNPQDALERSLVSEITIVRWRLERFAAMEVSLLENALRKKREELGPNADRVTLE